MYGQIMRDQDKERICKVYMNFRWHFFTTVSHFRKVVFCEIDCFIFGSELIINITRPFTFRNMGALTSSWSWWLGHSRSKSRQRTLMTCTFTCSFRPRFDNEHVIWCHAGYMQVMCRWGYVISEKSIISRRITLKGIFIFFHNTTIAHHT